MGKQKDLAGIGQRWSGWARIISTAITALAFLVGLCGVGNLLYDRIWQRKELAYTILPTYNLGGQTFTGSADV